MEYFVYIPNVNKEYLCISLTLLFVFVAVPAAVVAAVCCPHACYLHHIHS